MEYKSKTHCYKHFHKKTPWIDLAFVAKRYIWLLKEQRIRNFRHLRKLLWFWWAKKHSKRICSVFRRVSGNNKKTMLLFSTCFFYLFYFSFVTIGQDYVSVELRPLTCSFIVSENIYEWICSINGMISIGKNLRTRRKYRPSTALSTTNPIRTDMVGNEGLRYEEPTTGSLYRHRSCVSV
jgi:hypothetical protein